MLIQGRVLHPGSAGGEVIHLAESLSFWGGFDAHTGRIIDRSHPQVHQSLSDRVVVLTASRGSSATASVLAEAIHRGTGPAALVVVYPDMNLTAGALVAATLYGTACPVVQISEASAELLVTGTTITVNTSGQLSA